MVPLGDELLAFDRLDGSVMVYSRRTGRHLVVSLDTFGGDLTSASLGALAPPVRARLSRLGGARPPLELVACRHRATLLLPDEGVLWAPVPGQPGAGGLAYRAVPLRADARRLWGELNDARTLGAAAARAGVDAAAALEIAREWVAFDVQALVLRDSPARPVELRRLATLPRPPNPRASDPRGDRGETDLLEYHLAIDDADVHFDNRETTVAHALGLPHAALGGERYGERLRGALSARGWPVDGPVVEVGCGDGALVAAFRPEPGEPWLRVDLSPALLARQHAAAPHTFGILGDAVRLPIRSSSVPMLISNEVLADLTSVPVGVDHPGVEARRVRYALPRTARWDNLGSWQMLEEVARVLAPGGRAVLTEFGTLDEDDGEATQLDHPEVAIRFDLLERVAAGLGLSAEVVPLVELLSVDRAAPQLARHSWLALRARARALGVHLSARAASPADPLPFAVEGLEWVPQTDEGVGPLITRFFAILVQKSP